MADDLAALTAQIERLTSENSRLSTALAAAGPSPSSTADRQAQAALEEETIKALVVDLATTVFGVEPGQSSSLFSPPPGRAPSSLTNPYPRPVGVFSASSHFDLGDTPAGQQLRGALGASSGYYKECASWTPVLSNLWDLTSVLAGLLTSSDCPQSVLLAVGPRFIDLKTILDTGLRRLRVHELRASQGASYSEAYATQLSLQTRHARYLPSDAREFDTSAAQELRKRAVKASPGSRPKRPARPSKTPTSDHA